MQEAGGKMQEAGGTLTRTTAPWKKAAVLLILVLSTLALYPVVARVGLGEWTFPFDDPWTHQVYARNLAQAGQYAFNLGEPSTGSSAPLWTALMVPAHWLGLDPVLWALGCGLLALAGLGWIAWSWAEKRFAPPLPVLLTVGLLLSPHIGWSGVQGMETALVAAVSLLILWRVDQRPWQSGRSALLDGALNGLLLWLRPEAPLLTLAVAWPRRRAGWRRWLLFAVGYMALAVPYVGFNWTIGGRLLPQTVYAKIAYYGQPISPGSVFSFLGSLLETLAPGVWPLVLGLVIVAIVRMARRREWTWGPGLAWAAITVTVAALRLPVVLHFARHFVPILPPLMLAAGEGVQALPGWGRKIVFGLGLCLLLIGLVAGVSFYRPACQMILESQVAMGRWIAGNIPPAEAIATHDIGAIGYWGQHPVVDTLALITPELTEIVAARDTAGLLGYLQQHHVRYLARLAGQYPEADQLSGAHGLVTTGRMELLVLSSSGTICRLPRGRTSPASPGTPP
jgi:hypothetical protein